MLTNKELLEEKLIAMMEKFDKLSKLCRVLSTPSYSKIIRALDDVKEKYITEYEELIKEELSWAPLLEESEYKLIEDRALKGMAEVKTLAISEKIDNIYYICKVILKNDNDERLQKLKKMKNSLFETDNICLNPNIRDRENEYEGINKIQNGIISDLLEIEDVVSFPENRLRVVEACMADIKQSENFKNFKNVEEELRNIERLQSILKSYIPYEDPKEVEKVKHEISSLKFEILIRMQVERLIYLNSNENNCLLEYDEEEEKQIFKELLEKKRKSLIIGKADSIENDYVLRLPIDRIYESTELLKRLLVIDMERNPYEYINLVKAPIFNAHLCNIADDPFKSQNIETGLVQSEHDCETKKINFSVLKSILPLITDENISIAECENIYRKFGFECNPIFFNIGQKCVKMIYDKVKCSTQCEAILENSKKLKSNDEKYCAICFNHYKYSFEDKKNSRNLLSEILDEETLKVCYTEDIQKEISKAREEGSLIVNIDIIISLMNNIMTDIEAEEEKIENELRFMSFIYNLKMKELYKKKKLENRYMTELKDLKQKQDINEKALQLEETKKLLYIVKHVYEKLDIKYNAWEILPLEDLDKPQIKEVTSIDKVVRRSKMGEIKLPNPLIEKYGKDINELGIELKVVKNVLPTTKLKGSNDMSILYSNSNVVVNIDDISDLPIDYDKIELISKIEIEKDSKSDAER